MNTRGEIKAGVKTELSLVSTSTFISDPTLNDRVWDAYLWAQGLHPWPALRKAKSTVTKAGFYYYDYSIEFKSDSIFDVYVNGEEYDQKDFEDFLDWRRKNPTDTSKKIFATYARQLFLHPIPTADNLEIITWGLVQADKFVDDNSKTIFSDSEEELNEGVMRKCLGICLGKAGKKQEAGLEETRGKAILEAGWARIKNRRQRSQKLDNPMFDVPDFFAGNDVQSPIGNFSTRY